MRTDLTDRNVQTMTVGRQGHYVVASPAQSSHLLCQTSVSPESSRTVRTNQLTGIVTVRIGVRDRSRGTPSTSR
jgi:hypothetical protein